jgi:hypothetical protein
VNQLIIHRTRREDSEIERNQSQRNDGNAQFSLCCTSTAMPDDESQDRHPAFCFVQKRSNQESWNPGKENLIFPQLSTINYQLFFPGGIAQLVERQLCKLEVRGSNPLASIFARQKCRAVALAETDISATADK